MFAGRYYYAFAYVAGPEGGLNGILGRTTYTATILPWNMMPSNLGL